MSVRDVFARPLRSLRLSVVDRCNLRCIYCMPQAEYTWLPKRDILTFEEIEALVDVFLDLGVDKLRLTGGEPLVRRDLPILVARLARKDRVADLALTTNGVLLAAAAAALRDAGLHRITVSLDSLRRERYLALAQRDYLDATLAGIDAARRVGFSTIKLDTVVVRGHNDDEIVPLLEYARDHGLEIRFIEYMDVGGATAWSIDQVVRREEILARIEQAFGAIAPLPADGAAPASRFALADGTVFGIIASTTRPFCATCDRSRLTADGLLLGCLYATQGVDLRGPLRAGASRAELRALIGGTWARREDRGAESRLALASRGALFEPADLRDHPHFEMHTRGG